MGRRRAGSGALIIEPWIWASGGAVLGAIVGSFIATIVVRWPRGGSVRRGRSACDSCNAPLQPRDLVPLFSFLLLRGRCRYCAADIRRVHIVVEAIAALIGAAALLISPGIPGLAGAVFGWLLLLLATLDLNHFWLPDRVTALMAVLGLAMGALGTIPMLADWRIYPFFSDRVIGMIAGFLGLAAIAWLYRSIRKRDGLGGGDPKMLGAIGAWVGHQGLIPVVLLASIVGLSFVLAKALRRETVRADDHLPLGTLMAIAAFPIWAWYRLN